MLFFVFFICPWIFYIYIFFTPFVMGFRTRFNGEIYCGRKAGVVIKQDTRCRDGLGVGGNKVP